MTRVWRWAAARPDLTAIGALTAVLLAWFWPLLIGRKLGQTYNLWSNHPWRADRPEGVPRPHSGEGDGALFYEPILSLVREQVLDGRLPLWNPYSYGGHPLLGDLQSAPFHPFTWLAFALPVPDALGAMAVLKLLVAGAGAYALARALRVPRGGALLAGVAYMLSAPLVSWLQFPLTTIFATFPWVLLATDRLYRRPGPGPALALAALVTVSVLAGHPESVLLASSAAGVYLIALLVADRGGGARERVRQAAAWTGAHALGGAAAAVALVPFFSAYSDSITRDVHGDLASIHLPPSSGITYLLPNVFGDGMPGYEGPYPYYQATAAYVGIAVLLLAAVALVRNRRQPATWALAAMSGVALMVAFGVPPVSWFTQNVPPWSNGNNVRVFFVPALAAAVGAGAGLESLLRAPLALRRIAALCAGMALVTGAWLLADLAADRLPASQEVEMRAALRFLVVLAAGGALLAAAGRLRRPLVLALAIGLAIADLAYLHGYNVALPEAEAYPRKPASVEFLERRQRPFRVSVIRPGFNPPHVLPPNTPARYGLEGIQGYEYPLSRRWADLSWFVLGETGLSREAIYTSPRPSGSSLVALRMLNVRYYMTRPGGPPPNPAFRIVYDGRDADVYEDPGALPRAYVVSRTVPAGYRESLGALVAGRVDPRREALVPPDEPAMRGSAPLRAASVETVDESRVRVRVPAGAPGWLVLANAYSPDWRARVDGREVRPRPTDFAALGVRVDGRAQSVEFHVSDAPVRRGAAVSAVALAIMALLGAAALRRRARAA